VAEEAAIVQQLLQRGWAVSPGERYRTRTPPGIRITTTDLTPDEATDLAAALGDILHASTDTYPG
jgi:DNA-binding transcriptional MocR family regulator